MGQYETELLEKEYNVSTCTLMLHNVYGCPSDYSREKSQVIPSLIRKAVEFPSVKFDVWGSGTQGRAFVHVNDVVDAIILALKNGLGKGTFQIGPSECISIKEIAETIIEISGKDIIPYYDLSKPEGDKARSADFSRAKKILGWSPNVGLKMGLSELYSWIEKEILLGYGK